MILRIFPYIFLCVFLLTSLFSPSFSLAQRIVNTSLSVDVSGSMSGQKLQEAKNAASVYVDFIRRGDFVSVISFSNDAQVFVPTQPIISEDNRFTIKSMIDRLQASGSTNIGAGIRDGLRELRKTDINVLRNIVLMTDGQHNTGELWTYVDESSRSGVPVHTIGFGYDADMKTLCEISRRTGGFCFYADERNLSYIYHRAGLVVYNVSTLFSFSDFLRPGRPQDYPVFISDDVKDIVLFINWLNGSLSYDVVDGSGRRVPIREEKNGSNYRIVKLANPQERNIIVRLNPINLPQGGTQVNVSLAGDSPFYASVVGLKPYYRLKENVEIRVATGIIRNGKRIPIDRARVQVEITKPTEELIRKGGSRGAEINITGYLLSQLLRKEFINMYHEGNGIYVGNFKSSDLNGPYIVNVRVEGDVDGRPYRREFREIFNVGRVEDSRITVSDLFSLIKNFEPSSIREIPRENPMRRFEDKVKEIPLPIPIPRY